MIKLSNFNKIMEKVIQSAKQIEKSLAGIEETVQEAVRQIRDKNGQDE